MNIYQGEPLSAHINVKDGNVYVADLSSYVLEALLTGDFGVVKSWSTASQTITIGQETIEQATRGYASFAMSGSEVAELNVGQYTLEVAKVLSDGRAIGVVKCAVDVLPAKIRKGV